METLNFKEGQTYICIKSDKKWWTVGKEYTVFLDRDNEPAIRADDGDEWHSSYLSISNHQFKLKEENTMLQFKEGQTFVCKRDDLEWWTKDKEYKVVFDKVSGLLIVDDDGRNWYLPNDDLMNQVFKLKEKTVDLNTLTTPQLKEYVKLLENKEHAESSLNEFIERMTK